MVSSRGDGVSAAPPDDGDEPAMTTIAMIAATPAVVGSSCSSVGSSMAAAAGDVDAGADRAVVAGGGDESVVAVVGTSAAGSVVGATVAGMVGTGCGDAVGPLGTATSALTRAMPGVSNRRWPSGPVSVTPVDVAAYTRPSTIVRSVDSTTVVCTEPSRPIISIAVAGRLHSTRTCCGSAHSTESASCGWPSSATL